jgi:predicted RecB family nuclease
MRYDENKKFIERRKPMIISDEIFESFLYCKIKAHLKYLGISGSENYYAEWYRKFSDDFRKRCEDSLRDKYAECDFAYNMLLSPQVLKNSQYRLLVNCSLQTSELQSNFHALELFPDDVDEKYNPYIPIRFIPNLKTTQNDKLLLAFDALILADCFGKPSPFGKIIYSPEQKVAKVKLGGLTETTRDLLTTIIAQQSNSTSPSLILKKHCPECEFHKRCRDLAIEKDELTLLSGMTEKERGKLYNKGIFSVTQLSFTFRARRKPKRLASKPDKYFHALKALSIREQKIFIVGKPELNLNQNLIFLDVEGDSNQDFYYLIGAYIKHEETYSQYSFWADDKDSEMKIWKEFISVITQLESPQIIHYGHYESMFLKKMKDRYPEMITKTSLEKIINESVNLLSVIYAQIYFPIYSIGLKDLARYLGFEWSDNAASGLSALIWRSHWEDSRDSSTKQKLTLYNSEDCRALERITHTVISLCKKPNDVDNPDKNNIVFTDLLKKESPYHLGTNKFSLSELDRINKAAYWDYQRNKIYVRSSKRLMDVSKEASNVHEKTYPINEVFECQPPTNCPKCNTTDIYRHEKKKKTVYDLKFSQGSCIERWVIKYYYAQYRCKKCGATFYPQQDNWVRGKFGSNLLSYIIYQNIELRLSQQLVVQNLNRSFDCNLNISIFGNQKKKMVEIYQETYDKIFQKIVNGRLMHVDETRVSIGGENAYVWIFTSLEEVAYLYKPTRDGEFLHELLKEFKGVLVSDFYAAYDSIDCLQQKCLIHLIRDFNDDILKNPFDEELKGLVKDFASMLQGIIATIDQFGLKTHYLQKHKVNIDDFYSTLEKHDYQSEITCKYKKRLQKYRGKLFTFIDFDDIPWNNNNAEHAIKAFAMIRNVIGGKSSEKGIVYYLNFLSISETCKYKAISFLDFLRSGETDLDIFIQKQMN